MNGDFDPIFQQVGSQYGIDPDLLKAQAQYESVLDPNFKSKGSSASGLSGFTDATAQDYNVDRTDPKSSVDGQARYLKANYQKFASAKDPVGSALSAYKTGPNSDSYDSNYVNGVMDIYKDIKKNQAPSTTQSPGDKLAAKIQSYAPPPTADTVSTISSGSPDAAQQDLSPGDRMAAKILSYAPTNHTQQLAGVETDEPQASALDNARIAVGSPVGIGSNSGGLQGGVVQPLADYIPAKALPGIASDIMHGRNTQNVPAAELAYAANVETDVPGMKETGSAIAAGLGAGQGNTFGDRYNNLEQSQQALRQAGQEANPGATALGQASAMLAASPYLPQVGGNATTALGKIVAGGATGGLYGTAYGLGIGGDANDTTGSNLENRLSNALKSGAYGLGLGAAVPAALEAGSAAANALTGARTPATEKATNALHDIVGGPVSSIDTTTYVPGSSPTLANAAAYSGDAHAGDVAALEKTLGESSVGTSNLYNPAFADKAEQNSIARRNYVMQLTGSTDDLGQAYRARSDIAKNMLEDGPHAAAIWNDPAAKPADVQPVIDKINSILAGPDRGNPAVQKIMGNIKGLLTTEGPTGTVLQDDPEYLYKSGVKTINQWLESNHPADDLGQLAKAASPQVNQVKSVLQQAIKTAVPQYGDYLSAYSAASRPIDQMETLQALKLVNPESDQSAPTLAKINNALQKIQQQRSEPGTNPFKSLEPAHIQAIKNLQSDLERDQSAQKLLQTKGSPTSQNLQFVGKVKDALGANTSRWPQTIGASLGGSTGLLADYMGAPGPLSGVIGTVGAGAGERVGQAVANKMAAKGSKAARNVSNLLLSPQTYQAAQSARTAPGLLNQANPFNPQSAVGKVFAGTNYAPAIGYGANKLLQASQPSNP